MLSTRTVSPGRTSFSGEFFLWFLFGDRLCHFLFSLVETLAKLLAFTLNCGSIHVIIMEFMEKLHRLIGIILGFLENLVSFFVGLADDAVFLYIQFFLFGFKLFLKSLRSRVCTVRSQCARFQS